MAIKVYWSNTKFAERIRGVEKPYALSMRGWKEWKADARAKHPIRYWISDILLDNIQEILHWPSEKLHDVKYYCLNRWKTKSHALTSNLPRGQWYDYDTRILHSMFDELVNFVEFELAWSHIAWDKKARETYKVPFWGFGWFKTRTWRSAEAGIAHLKWAMSLGNQSPSQADAAKEILDLYNWWTKIRPTRLDPHDASGWSTVCDSLDKKGHVIGDAMSSKDTKMTRDSLDRCAAIEEAYHSEDDAMLIRLIKVRRNMWT